jgi:NAD-dependent dihydropyrimidine dehydrogenase PreA subunit
MKRTIIDINQEKCTGCGLCIPNCPEGAIQIIDGKARLVSDLMCDGLGACLGHCPEGAITKIEREAEAYDERKVMLNIIPQGVNTIKAHLVHLHEHGQTEFLNTALATLKDQNIEIPTYTKEKEMAHTGCPGSQTLSFAKSDDASASDNSTRPSQLTQWPVQMHLISPNAPYYQGADVLLAADCTAYAMGDFHKDWLKGRALAIACPKLDEGQDIYIEKIKALIDEAKINTLTVLIMQVPCCSGLVRMAQTAVSQAQRKVPVKTVVVGLQGQILKEEWI